MHVIWKRPDGFHAASPADFEVVELTSSAKLWLHKRDQENFLKVIGEFITVLEGDLPEAGAECGTCNYLVARNALN